MFKPIINISTSLEKSAIGIIRLSFGKINKKIIFFFFKKFFFKKIKPKIINYVFFYNFKNIILDKGIVIFFKKPSSYTGEDLIEMHFHGNHFILKKIIALCIFFLKKYKISISKRGEFTKRAFYNGKINFFELEFITNILNFKKKNFLKYRKLILNYNLKNFFLKILKKIENIEIFFNINKKLKNFFNLFFYIKKKIFFLINKFNNIKTNKKKILILTGLVNVGKSTLSNKLLKKNFSIVSSKKGTTRDIIEKIFKIGKKKYIIYDSPGFNNFKNSLEYVGILLFLNKKNISDFIIYFFDNKIFYNIYFYYIIKRIKKSQILIKIINKIDFLINFPFFEININKKIKNIILKISSKKEEGIVFFLNEIKRLNFEKKIFFNKILFSVIKKFYKSIIKVLFFINTNNRDFFFLEILKLKKIINYIVSKKNKTFYNKIFKKFCIGK